MHRSPLEYPRGAGVGRHIHLIYSHAAFLAFRCNFHSEQAARYRDSHLLSSSRRFQGRTFQSQVALSRFLFQDIITFDEKLLKIVRLTVASVYLLESWKALINTQACPVLSRFVFEGGQIYRAFLYSHFSNIIMMAFHDLRVFGASRME